MSKSEYLNAVRWRPDMPGGFVESLFLKFHLADGSAFWARYTLRRSRSTGASVGCLWAVMSRPGHDHVAGCNVFGTGDISYGSNPFRLKIGSGELSMGRAVGNVEAVSGDTMVPIGWDLDFELGGPCLAHFPFLRMYGTGFPRNKIASPHVGTRFFGTISIGEDVVRVEGAPGMQGHNWGPDVAGHWIWCHANAFEDEADAVFEAVSSRIGFGPLSLPPLTIVYLRAGGREVLLNSPLQLLGNKAGVSGLSAFFDAPVGRGRIRAGVEASPEDTVALDYVTSSGSTRRVLNSNRASLQVEATGIPGGPLRLNARRNATLELGGGATAGTPALPVSIRC